MKVDIVAPSHSVFSGKAAQVRVPAVEGELGILAGHTPLVSLLTTGEVRVATEDGTEDVFPIEDGFVTVDHDHIYILVNDRA